ncbi:MAG: AsmA family protein [Spirochaetota bacterium]|nr:AsmA family protein [Spirochaetota bacterium]
MKRLKHKNLTIFKKLLLGASLLFIITAFIIMFMLYSNRHYYKDVLLQKLSEYTLFRLSANSLEIKVFPTISLIMKDVDIEFKGQDAIYKIFKIKRLKLTISLKSLFSDKIHLRNIYFHKGDLYLYSKLFQAGNKPTQRFDLSKLSQILSISFTDIGVHYYNKYNRLKHSFLVNKLNLDSDITGNNIILDCSIDSGFMRLRGEVGNIDFYKQDLKQIEFNAILSLTNFPIYILKKYLQSIPFSKTARPLVTGEFRITKKIIK